MSHGVAFRYFPVRDEDYLEHHGILGMKWGVRRFQNPDGSLTAKGKARREKIAGKIDKTYDKMDARIKKYSEKFAKKGQTRKVEIANEMLKRNAEARKLAKKNLMEGDADYEKKSLKADMKQVALGDLKLNDLSAASGYSRMSLDMENRSFLSSLKYEKVSELDKMSVDAGIRYLEMVTDAKKKTNQYGMYSGTASAVSADTYRRSEQAKYAAANSKYKADISSDHKSSGNNSDAKEMNDFGKRQIELNAKGKTSEARKVEKEAQKAAQQKLERARKEDKFDIDFIEKIQNKKLIATNNTKELMDEYAKYLDDPNHYNPHYLKDM